NPDPGLAAGGEPGAVGAVGHSHRSVTLSLKRLHQGGVRPVPDLDGAVEPRGGQACSLGVERKVRDSAAVFAQRAQFLAGLEVPHLQEARVAGEPDLPVTNEMGRPVISFIRDVVHFLSTLDVPDSDAALGGAAGVAFAVGGEATAKGSTFMAPQRAHERSRF